MSGTVNIVDTSALATHAKQDTGNASLASLDGKTTVCNTGAVTVAACALPTGAATAAAQATGNASLSSIDGKVTACNTGAVVVASSSLPTGAATAALQGAGLPGALGAGGGVKIDGSGTPLPVSGSVTATISGTPAVTVSSSALPTGAATDALQTTGNGFLSTLAGIVASGAALVKLRAGDSYNSAALERSCVASAAPASPSLARMWNGGASTRFLQGHNATSLPGNGAIPNDVVNASASAAAFIQYVCPSDSYDIGVVYACSTTATTLTITGANDALFSVHLFPAAA